MSGWPDQETTVAIATALSALFTAGAAGAALLSVRQGQRVWRASIEPDLHLQILKNGNTGTTDLIITNSGGGMAKGTAYMLAAGGMRVHGFLGDGFVAPGDKILVSTSLPSGDPENEGEALAMYRVADESSYAVTHDGRKRRLRRGRTGGSTTGQAVWTQMHPDAGWGQLRWGQAGIQWVEKRGALHPQVTARY